jgi:hypothetical protein
LKCWYLAAFGLRRMLVHIEIDNQEQHRIMPQYHRYPTWRKKCQSQGKCLSLTADEQHWFDGQDAPPADGPQFALLKRLNVFGGLGEIEFSRSNLFLIGLYASGMHASVNQADSTTKHATEESRLNIMGFSEYFTQRNLSVSSFQCCGPNEMISLVL